MSVIHRGPAVEIYNKYLKVNNYLIVK